LPALTLLLLGAFVRAAANEGGYQLEVMGEGDCAGFKPGDTKPVYQYRVGFRMSVSNCVWIARAKRSDDDLDYIEVGESGGTIFTIMSRVQRNAQRQARGEQVPVNNSSAGVERVVVPHTYFCPHISILWLAYASGCYFKSVQTTEVEP